MVANVFTKDADKYLKPDVEGGFLTNKDEIESEAINRKLEIIDNLLLGNFDNEGNYYLSQEIVDELVKTPKRTENNFNGILFFASLKMFGRFGQLKFSIKFIEENGHEYAKLYLLEPISKANGYFVNTNTYLLCKIKNDGDSNFHQNVLTFFHVRPVTDAGDSKTEFAEEEYPAIFNRKWMLIHLQVKKDLAINPIQKKYFEKRMEILEKTLSPEQLIKIKEELKRITDIFVKKESKTQHKELNEVLTKVVGDVKLPEVIIKEIKSVQKEFEQQAIKIVSALSTNAKKVNLSYNKAATKNTTKANLEEMSKDKTENEETELGSFNKVGEKCIKEATVERQLNESMVSDDNISKLIEGSKSKITDIPISEKEI